MLQAVMKSQGVGAGERLLTQRDRRADGGARHVRVTRGDILIARRFDGIEMMIAAPVEAYRGVGLVTQIDLQGKLLNRVVLIHRDADLDIVLGETRHSDEAEGAWVEWAAWFGLARLAMLDEEWSTVDMPAGQRPTGLSAAMRRRPTSPERRRPSFRMRRKSREPREPVGVTGKDRDFAGRE